MIGPLQDAETANEAAKSLIREEEAEKASAAREAARRDKKRAKKAAQRAQQRAGGEGALVEVRPSIHILQDGGHAPEMIKHTAFGAVLVN